MSNQLSLYDCNELISQIETEAEQNGGELSEETWALLVQAHTTSLEKVGKIIGLMKHLESFIDTADAEIEKAKAKKQIAKNHLENVKKFILPYVREKGKVSVGINTLSIRKSRAVIVAEDFVNPQYCRTIPAHLEPDKKLIKESIESGICVQGAVIEERESVQVK